MCDDHVFHGVVPQTKVDELAEEPGADDLEFASEDTTSANVAGGKYLVYVEIKETHKKKVP